MDGALIYFAVVPLNNSSDRRSTHPYLSHLSVRNQRHLPSFPFPVLSMSEAESLSNHGIPNRQAQLTKSISTNYLVKVVIWLIGYSHQLLLSRLPITSFLRQPSEHHNLLHLSQWVSEKVRAESDGGALIAVNAIASSLRPMHATVSGKVCADRPGRIYTNNVTSAIPAYNIRTARPSGT